MSPENLELAEEIENFLGQFIEEAFSSHRDWIEDALGMKSLENQPDAKKLPLFCNTREVAEFLDMPTEVVDDLFSQNGSLWGVKPMKYNGDHFWLGTQIRALIETPRFGAAA